LKDYLAEQLERYTDAPRPELELHLLAGPPAKEIVRVARSVGADLVIVGTHGRRGVRRLVLGSVAEEVLRSAPCPVLVVRGKDWAASA
jgi:nucleotide-binding universal stress UspA family protein